MSDFRRARRSWLLAGLIGVPLLVMVAVLAAFVGLLHPGAVQSDIPAAAPPAEDVGVTTAAPPDEACFELRLMPDDKIPAGKEYGPIEVPASKETAAMNIDPSEFIPFPHRAKEDWALYQELRASGAAFKLVPGDDGYFPIQR